MPDEGQSEVDALRKRLGEAEETLRAIGAGEVDALVISTSKGDQVFTLKSAEQSYRIFIEQMEEGAVMLSRDGLILYCNAGFAKIMKAPIKDLIGNYLHNMLTLSHSETINRLLSQAGNYSPVSGKEITFKANDGSLVPTQISISKLDLDGLDVTCLVATDLTKHMEREIKKYTAQLEKMVEERTQKTCEQADLLDKANDAIVVRDLENRITYWNKGAERIYGWSANEVLGKCATDFLCREPGKFRQIFDEVMRAGIWNGEIRHLTKEGKEIVVESRWTLVSDSNQKPKSILTISTDATERKNLQAQYLRAQRLESLGTLAGGIAHDFRNILTPIMITLSLIDQNLTKEEDHEMIASLQRNLQRGADLSNQLLTFARGVKSEHVLISIPALIFDVEKTIKETFPRSIQIEAKAERDILAIMGDNTQLQQVLINMCINARDAMPFGGSLSIKAENAFLDQYYSKMHPEAKVGPYVVISIIDNGTGMPPDVLDRLFEPFFTTKKTGEGTGLGLSTARSIIKSHDGFISVYSEVGKGTTFKVYLPVTEIKSGTTTAIQFNNLPKGRGQTILIVDDEELIRITATAALENNGYRALEANDGAEALGVYAAHKDEIKAILLDMAMPIMDGEAAIRALRKIDPEAKIIGMSGFSEDGKYKAIHDVANAFIMKPFTAKKLLETIAKVLPN
jgi:hypothetical protein